MPSHTAVGARCRFELSRIQLAPFTTKDRYKQGYSDFPADVLEKVYSKALAKYVLVGTFLAHGPPPRVCFFACRIAPLAVQMYQRFSVSNAQQEELLAVFEFSGAFPRLATSAPGTAVRGFAPFHGRIDTCAQTA